ncbi:ATP-dependent bile acid permease [Wickerhamomyces ciferrii]|uniref:ATP-dependent bile acid permease n=1 Tax=Wickerhamomyces ciferrii (strain ATCC 14091 / BCRC 22168 / CBS 111 / JCM 3599 / NBRC 0793 / NRRL Y-1031 F-60-10) TaxID=1206466 RepID=K0KNR5_WICCF|nr:ATP-dependent bile acid permease [Wickerhamomyces ciferrii]CCH46915.1 ATP-dependent bile acid permease [Wickerhamomyces ciferrii]
MSIKECPIWDFDDLSECARVNYLETGLPLLLVSVSILVILIKALVNYREIYKNSNSEYKPLLGNDTIGGHGAIETQDFTQVIKYSHFDISSLPNVKLNGKPHGELTIVQRSLGEKLRVILEELLILAQISIQFSKIFTSEVPIWSISINLLLWGWLLIGTSFRIINLNDTYKHVTRIIPNLWTNSFVIYLFLWFPSFISLRSAIIGHTAKNPQYYIWDFIIISILFVNLLTSHIGYHLPSIYKTDEESTPAPEPITSIISFVTFSWVDKLIWTSYLDTLKINQVWDLPIDDYSYYVQKNFKILSDQHSNWSFAIKLVVFFKKYLFLQAFWAITETLILFTPTLLLKKILEFVEDESTTSKSLAWYYVFLMFGFKLLASVSSGQALFLGRRVCIRLKSIIISEIYAKALRKKLATTNKKDDEDEKTEGEDEDPQKSNEHNGDEESEKTSANLGAIINLMAVDAEKVSEVCAYLHAFVGATFMIIVSIILLYNLLGWSAMIGALSIICVAPLSFKVNGYLGVLQKKMLSITDSRIQKLNETFQSIRIIKFFAWEDKFRDQIYKIRHDELSILKKRSLVWVVAAFLWFITPTIITFVSFGCYIFIDGKTLTTPVAFTALSLFNLLRNPLDQISDMLSFAIQSKVSLDRVSEFLKEEESTKYEQLTTTKSQNKIGFKNASFSWDSKSEIDFKLKNLNIDFKTKKLNVIIGPTGSGKTSLLMALLGEMEKLQGDVYLPGFQAREDLIVDAEGYTESVAYCSQAAWLLNDSIKNNIIFASPFNKTRYNKVVEACGLTRDFEILKAGDQTEIGEKGIALSGGQKQRVSLARALYSNSRHILLDDCLSAVDSHTALHIYENCISGPLMKNRTVLLVSHNVALTIKSAEFVVIMDNGKVVNQGTPQYLLDVGALGDDEMIKSSVLQSKQNSSVNLKKLANDEQDISKAVEDKLKNPSEGKITLVDEEAEELENLKKGKLIEEESKSDGVVSIEVYKWYLKTFGGWSIILILLGIYVIDQFVYISQSWWVRSWARNMEQQAQQAIMITTTIVESNIYSNTLFKTLVKPLSLFIIKYHTSTKESLMIMKEKNESVYYITIYTLLGVAYAGISSIRLIITFLSGIKASSRIFKKVLQRVLRAKLRFYDSTPIGRIMNRFSKDIEAVDQELVPFADGAIACVVSVFSILVLISLITPGFIFLAILIVALYYSVAFFYLNGSRELKRYEAITKSPIHQHFGETLVGVSTIRAYGIERRFLQENLIKIDNNNKPFIYMWITNRWLSIRNDLVGSLIILFSGAFVLLNLDKIDSGLAGISLSYAIAFNESALWVVRLYANVEMTMNSVERLQEYLSIDEEPAEYIPENEPPTNWPSQGKLEVNDLSLRYAPTLPRVIKNVTFNVEPSNKIGIVGRTGAGKSTIITALFRFLDPETGYIKIDDIDITSIGLKNLRQAITIIPQDPTLFTGTIRSNLDPFDNYNDENIFEALRRVNLISGDDILNNNNNFNNEVDSQDENVNKFLNLENEITEGGGNLSQGQRQLMCLARSLLKSPKIMLLDEATASIDYESDSRIQQTIRQEFATSTILTIAHRLRSIIDYDKILVMDAGEVIEFDHPYNLIKDVNSTFHSMCSDSGELEVLIQLAKEAFLEKFKK